ncbi:MAG: D-tyrosyl-tRNA(Tyr) deacylase [Nitrospinaceae bacterium]|jgi:D-aminoacyl-tRNA deacylase|nr:D-tyrosyl-tRNA(Tyr) deacylase [Nitrospinaceae bacterium]MBT3433138.1 D-tyrosyl-tRNA(Tyr) deacylase [Nitrospinaceae bacterium]MBT3821962.1 D-tyrosyl-tRNA(Tyr) deacylase [Nitrospinaceae bacterium]MBT4432330.1 D-tyrosyl-tRNA(Tyr) deacylase [Nitrospinaceae bacterium]MBT5368035.1 D-tyrosyl-tRNA(Tyr) deacylase [Nitrospinaceae bacterium]
MLAVIQRVRNSSVSVSGEVVGKIGPGIMILIGVGPEDTEKEVHYLADKSVHLRIFPDEGGKMNRSLLDSGGEMLIISQFTLYGDCRKGRRPSFTGAAPPELAKKLIEQFVAEVGKLGVTTATGRFGAMMDVELINDGPVTLILDSSGAF